VVRCLYPASCCVFAFREINRFAQRWRGASTSVWYVGRSRGDFVPRSLARSWTWAGRRVGSKTMGLSNRSNGKRHIILSEYLNYIHQYSQSQCISQKSTPTAVLWSPMLFILTRDISLYLHLHHSEVSLKKPETYIKSEPYLESHDQLTEGDITFIKVES